MNKNSLFQYKWFLVGLLWVAYFLNQGDRQIFNTVIPLIKADLGLTDYDIGDVVMIFTAVYGILVPISGFLGDLISRKWIVIWSLLIFSGGTLCTGLSGGIVMLIVFRSVATGGGEAFYFPAATSLLSQLHSHTRATALSIHQTSLYVGIIASGFISGYIGEHYGWRAAFYVFGSIGVIWAVLCIFAMQNTPMPAPSESSDKKVEKTSFSKMLGAILKSRLLLPRARLCLPVLRKRRLQYLDALVPARKIRNVAFNGGPKLYALALCIRILRSYDRRKTVRRILGKIQAIENVGGIFGTVSRGSVHIPVRLY